MSDSPVFSRRMLSAAGLALAAALGGLCSCQSDGDGNPSSQLFRGADVTIRGAGIMEVRHAVVDVMDENGFRLASPFGSIMTFEKDGTRHDEWMYGSYGSGPLRQRVTITIAMGDAPDTIELVASGNVVREYSHMSGEETGYLLAGGALRYGKYLDMIKDHVEGKRRESLE